ncbi:MAG: helix-hairpin-helix domain-containing protein [Deltaproteobacteria bacterium]|nr:helix-hairpin-helix domain-containing protein [Deltaproteobacteria bacterium]
MKIREGQSLGIMAVLLASLAVYGAALSNGPRVRSSDAVPWADQRPGTVAVQVSGDRGAEGIYFLPAGTPLGEALRLAGISGGLSQAGPDETLPEDGISLHVSPEGRVATGDLPAITRLALGLPIDVNQASAEELEMVPGIGEKLAARIVEARQEVKAFESLSELTNIPGIKEKKLEAIGPYLTVRPKRTGATPTRHPGGRPGTAPGNP